MTEKMNGKISIAIDGPSGAGKSTLARSAAQKFGLIYADTGAIYRTVGLAARRAGVEPGDVPSVLSLLTGIRIDLCYENGVQRMYMKGSDVTDYLRSPEISIYASAVSAIPEVRDFLMDMQRSLAERYDVVMDGRDIGTVVLPNASLKIFLTADPEERARRRYLELSSAGSNVSFEQVLSDMELRDKNDSSRAAAPLRAAPDAIVLNTTGNSLEKSEKLIFELISEKLGL